MQLRHLSQDTDLWFALRGAGSSFAVVTEFLVRVWPRPETLPIIIPVSEQPLEQRNFAKVVTSAV